MKWDHAMMIILAFGSIIFFLVFGGYMFGEAAGKERFYEVCSEAMYKNIKLETCGYYKWQATPTTSEKQS